MNSQNKTTDLLRRYLPAFVAVLIAHLITKQIEHHLGETISPLFFAAVMISAWYGGWGPGLLATGLAGYLTAYQYVNPPLHPWFGVDDAIRVGVFFMVSSLISILTAMRRRAEAALQRSYAELETRIEQRTHELRESNNKLTQSEERFRLLVEGVADYAIVMLDASGKIISWNAGAQRIHGYGQDEAIGLDITTFFSSEDVSKRVPFQQLQYALEHGRDENEGWRVRKNSTRFWANVITTALTDERGRPRGFAQITRDITELRSLEKEVLDITEREQMRIGHDLHDGIGQELTGLALLAQNLRHKLAMHDLAEAADAGRIATLINRTLDQTRQLVRGFSPMELGPEGLEPALRDLAAKIQATTRQPCIFQCKGTVLIADDAVAVHLYRIAQGAIGNAVRHSHATEIRLTLSIVGAAVTLAIEDNGIGLPPESQRGPGIGISVMKYRARMIGATLDVISPAKGTRIVCTYSTGEHHEPNSVDQEPINLNGQTAGASAAR